MWDPRMLNSLDVVLSVQATGQNRHQDDWILISLPPFL